MGLLPDLVSGGRTSAEKPPQSPHVVDHVGHRDRCLGTRKADGPDDQPHPILLMAEDMLDLRADDRLAAIGP